MRGLLRVLRSRRMAVGILTFLVAVALASTYVPQRSVSSDARLEAWRAAHAGLVPFVDALGLDRVYSTAWFLAAAALCAAAMAVATSRHAMIAWRLTRGETAPPAGVPIEGSDIDALVTRARLARYLPVASSREGVRRWVRDPWGLWGGVVLHAGMLLGLLAVLLWLVTRSVASVTLLEGERLERRGPFDVIEAGAFSSPMELTSPLTLEGMTDSYWDNGEMRQMIVHVVEAGPSVDLEREARIGAPMRLLGGETLYSTSSFGEAFLVDVSREGRELVGLRLELERPASGTTAYHDFVETGMPYLLRAKYEVRDPAGFRPEAARLALRLDDASGEVDRVELGLGEEADLGPYRVGLADVRPWVRVTIAKGSGIELLFTSFFIIFAGGILLYGAPPRELWLVEQEHGWLVGWRALRFDGAFTAERDRLIGAADAR